MPSGKRWTCSPNSRSRCGLDQISWRHRHAVGWTFLGEKVRWGRGLGTETARPRTSFAFRQRPHRQARRFWGRESNYDRDHRDGDFRSRDGVLDCSSRSQLSNQHCERLPFERYGSRRLHVFDHPHWLALVWPLMKEDVRRWALSYVLAY